ncbi:NACHT domain-containing NTPase [Lentzea sp. HUAS12]|uniref:NACHT domain-containing protein n=1 Tax=Lentzea sp. HUAS12 TaxID=2951806 RepID=UPI0020A0A6E5|nr:NACHT domain-containing protein [Lentzea sp. HUAS12]USX51766.1 NACHT domain-containing protein [Lentzea sp. HUAS12]
MADPFSAGLLMVLETVLERVLLGLFEVVHKGAKDKKRQRELTRPGPLVERVSAELARGELSTVEEHEWQAAVDAVRESIEASLPLRPDEALKVMLTPESLRAHVMARSERIRRAAGLSEQATAVYDALLLRVCVAVVELVWSQPEYARRLAVEVFRMGRATADAVARLADQRQLALTAAHRDFEDRYADQVAYALGGLELFGVTRGRAPRRHSFDSSYVSLAVARVGDTDELTGAGLPVAAALADAHRVLIRGGAGAGKTTFLRWLAMNALGQTRASGDEWLGLVPFFVPLRQCTTLPKPEEFISATASMIEEEKPPGWVTARLKEGRALVLVDGVDELVWERRAEARRWLEELVTAYPGARYAVTTRPAAVPEDWLEDLDFAAFDLLPLSDKGVRDFVEAWHTAARDEPGLSRDARVWLTDCEARLVATLVKRPDLRRLASSPLLAGLLCALHQDRNMHLPRDRRSLYEAALDLLLVRWDEDRGLALPSFSKEEQLVLLQRFAYSLVRNRELTVPREEAVHRLGNAMRGLRSHDVDPDVAMQRLLERAGLLREVPSERVQFVHRTFRDYLAAKEVVDAGDLNLLVDRAHLDEWHDVVVMAVAHARPRERARVLMDLLAGNDDTRKDERGRDKLRLLALACLDQADVIEPETARAQVTAAAASLIPPTSFAHADALSEAGSFVVDLLPGPEASGEAAYIVRTLATIGGEGAWERIAEFVAVDHAMVIDELLRAWRNTPDAEKYARSVLSKVDFGDRRVDVRGWHRIQFIMHLEKLRYVRCIGNINPLDPLGAMPSLHRLELWQNEVMRDLSPLGTSRSLKELHLSRCRPLGRIDLAPVKDLDELHLHFSRVDLESLDGGALRRLQIRDSGTDEGLAALPDLPALRELAIDHRPPYPLAGLERWPTVTALEVFGVPAADDLRALPALDRLVVHQPESLARLEELRGRLPGVTVTT